ncbi:MAG TPA: VOC family protein [Edaphobacter sp.]|nr:VOC family protein [Edaphobacter sp.]
MKKAAALLCLLASFASAQTRPAITGIAFVRMYAADPTASTAFYKNKLGFDQTIQGSIAHYAVNDTQWLEVTALPSPAPQSRIAAIAFTTRNAAALEQYLKAHAVTIDQPLRNGSFGVHDPEGQLVIFVQQRPASSKVVSPRATARRIIHTGFWVHDRAKEDHFWRDLLGFRPLWFGGAHDGELSWISSQVPNGTDWIEYMLDSSANPSPHSLGSMNHFSLGVAQMSDAIQALARNGCTGPECRKTQMGRDGKVQLNLFDPDLTRVEYMEFKTSGKICCSPFTGPPPTEKENR